MSSRKVRPSTNNSQNNPQNNGESPFASTTIDDPILNPVEASSTPSTSQTQTPAIMIPPKLNVNASQILSSPGPTLGEPRIPFYSNFTMPTDNRT